MPRRRANGEGSVYWSDSYRRYVGQATMARDGDKLERKKIFGRRGDRSRAARVGVQERLKPYLRRPASNYAKTSLRRHVDQWIATAPVREGTRDYYRWASKHLGELGRKPLLEIEPIDVRRHLDGLKVGPRMRRAVYSLLHRVLREAVELELIVRNPAAAVTAPKMPRRQTRALTPEEVQVLLEACAGDRLEALVILALTSTMGPAEMLALRRKDVHLNDGYVDVTADLVATTSSGYRPVIDQTKTARRRRRINLPQLAIDALRAHETLSERGQRRVSVHDRRRQAHSPDLTAALLVEATRNEVLRSCATTQPLVSSRPPAVRSAPHRQCADGPRRHSDRDRARSHGSRIDQDDRRHIRPHL